MPGSDVVPKLLTMDDLAERLGVSQRHVRRLVAEKRVPYLKVGRFIRFGPAQNLGLARVETRRCSEGLCNSGRPEAALNGSQGAASTAPPPDRG